MEITYKLHDLQFQIFNDPARFVVVAAGRRFGKTVLAIVKMITVALNTKKALVWYVAPTYKQAKMIAWDMLLEMLPKELIVKKNEVELEVQLLNGSSICLKGADNEDSLRGAGLDFVVLDEYASMKPNVWQEIIRPMLSDRQAPALFIGTPKGKNHFWEIWVKGQKTDAAFSSYQAKTEMNPYIPRAEIKDAQETMNERYFKQEYEASFEDFTGLIWPEFNQKSHVIQPFEFPSYFEKIGALDFATTGTTAALFGAIDEDKNLFIYEEYYAQDKRASEVSDSLRGKVNFFYADPAGHRKELNKNGLLYSFFEEYQDYGITLMDAQNDVNAGINRVAENFKRNKIKIFSTCKNLLQELERYHWSEEKETANGILAPKPYKNFDHACDCLRYMVMSHFERAYIPKPRSKDRALPMAGELLEMR